MVCLRIFQIPDRLPSLGYCVPTYFLGLYFVLKNLTVSFKSTRE